MSLDDDEHYETHLRWIAGANDVEELRDQMAEYRAAERAARREGEPMGALRAVDLFARAERRVVELKRRVAAARATADGAAVAPTAGRSADAPVQVRAAAVPMAARPAPQRSAVVPSGVPSGVPAKGGPPSSTLTGGDVLRYRKERGLTQVALARLLGVEQSTVCKGEQKVREPVGEALRAAFERVVRVVRVVRPP